MSPLCERFISAEQRNEMEPFYPLYVYVCDKCYLVQLEEYVTPEHIFTEYAYFSSYSTTWVAHAKAYCEMIAPRLGLGLTQAGLVQRPVHFGDQPGQFLRCDRVIADIRRNDVRGQVDKVGVVKLFVHLSLLMVA